MLSVSNLTCKLVSDTRRNERYSKGILVVNFMCHVHKGTQIFAQTVFWIYLWGCSWMRLTFESIDWGKKIFLPKVGRPYPISQSFCSNRTTDFFTSNRELLLHDFLDLGHQFLSDLDNSYTLGFLGSQALVWNCPVSSGSPPSEDLGILSLYNCMSQFLIINIWSFLIKHTNIFSIVHFFLREKIFSFNPKMKKKRK